MQVLKLIT